MHTHETSVRAMQNTMDTSSPTLEKGDKTSINMDKPVAEEALDKPKKGLAFWMIIFSLMMSTLLSALDLTAVTTALSTISEDLHSTNFSWIGSAYALCSTAFLPIFGGLAQSFGRKPILLMAIAFFAIGSAIAGSATNMSAMIAARAIQGTGGGGILAMSEITVADLVPLSERGAYVGLFGLVWALASAVGPVTGGAIADANWRWIFYLNLPLSILAFILVFIFMTVRKPEGTFMHKLKGVDWLGGALFVIAATLLVFALTVGGSEYSWSSATTLAPLILGVIFFFVFLFVEKRFVSVPLTPFELFNRTSLMSYITTFLHGIAIMMLVYFLPAYLIACLGDSPVLGGLHILPVSLLIAPFAIACGISVTITKKYLPQNIGAWVLVIVGAAVLTLLKSNTRIGAILGLQVPISIGLGILYSATAFPLLAPLPPPLSANALAFQAFSRSFGQVIGITVGTVVLTNRLAKTLPTEILNSLPDGASSAYSVILTVKDMPEPLRSAFRSAWADATRYIWYVLIGFSVVGLVASCFMKALPLHSVTDEAWGISEKPKTSAAVSEA